MRGRPGFWPVPLDELVGRDTTGENMNLLTEHAKDLLGMPADWDAYEFEAIGRTADQPAKLYRVTGAVAPIKSRGKYKGQPNWDRLDKSTLKTAYFTPAEHDDWASQWSKRTGKCLECMGRGERFAGWSKKAGTHYKPCDKCGATGIAPNACYPTSVP